ncbi:uncharacterized protein LOC119444535 isoform X1 [Dermacentor silvarum]|uniref:uncharacterized protein LOC119444535 isoform X1 n=1 Tax=Dermacentor silvarum TaxID=543639 RepID=UPI002100C57B|nr:uncharacterized protein LOC119444535 isoform X1 [Dermacentor silvarum]
MTFEQVVAEPIQRGSITVAYRLLRRQSPSLPNAAHPPCEASCGEPSAGSLWEHTPGDGAAKKASMNGHANVSDGGCGPGVSSFATNGGGTHKRRNRDTKMPAPDGGLSWMVAVVCFLVNMISCSYARCMGLFFSAFMSTFGVSRAEASLPLSVYTGFMFLSGLISGILIQACGTRKAATIGGILITVGLSVSFFAEGVTVLAVTAGFLSGSGHGIILNSSVVCVSRHFDRRRGTALGLNMAGATIASLVFPKVYEYLLAEYGLRGTLLIIGASMGNVVPLAMIMNAPPWEVADHAKNAVVRDVTDTCLTQYDAPTASCPNEGQDKLYLEIEQPPLTSLHSGKPTPISVINCGEGIYRRGTIISLSEKSSVIGSRRGTAANMGGDAKMMSRRSTLLSSQLSTTSRRGTFASCAEADAMVSDVAPDLNDLRARRGTMLSVAGSMYASNKVSRRSIAADATQTRRGTIVSISSSCRLEASPVRSESRSLGFPTTREEEPSPPSLLRNVMEVLKNPRFYFHALSYVSWGFFVDCFLTVVFDFAKDAGVARSDTVYALTFFSATDTVGRLFVPFLSDYGLISNCCLLTIAYLTLGLLQQAAPYVRGKQGVWALAGAFGLPAGYIMVGASQILSAEIGSKNLPIAFGFMSTATATGSFVRPLVIGFFRDNYGSYKGLFRLIGGMLAVSFVFTLGLWITGRSRERKVANVIPDASVFIHDPMPTIKEEDTVL